MSAAQFHKEVMAELEQIEVTAVVPPIPFTDYDYVAVRKGYEPGDPVGYGPTPEAAIAALQEREA